MPRWGLLSTQISYGIAQAALADGCLFTLRLR